MFRVGPKTWVGSGNQKYTYIFFGLRPTKFSDHMGYTSWSNFDAQTLQLFFALAPNGLYLWCGMDPRQLMHILVLGELRYNKWLTNLLGAVVQVTSQEPNCSRCFRSDVIYLSLPLQVFTNGDSKILGTINCF